jgi:hypothetical protein
VSSVLHPDFTGSVGTQVEIEVLASYFPSFLSELALHGATRDLRRMRGKSAGEWVEGLLGEFARYLPECRIDTKGTHRASWVDRRGSSFPGYIQLRKEHLVSPGDRVIDSEGLMTLAIL